MISESNHTKKSGNYTGIASGRTIRELPLSTGTLEAIPRKTGTSRKKLLEAVPGENIDRNQKISRKTPTETTDKISRKTSKDNSDEIPGRTFAEVLQKTLEKL